MCDVIIISQVEQVGQEAFEAPSMMWKKKKTYKSSAYEGVIGGVWTCVKKPSFPKKHTLWQRTLFIRPLEPLGIYIYIYIGIYIYIYMNIYIYIYGFLNIRTGILDYLRESFPWPAQPFQHTESNSFKHTVSTFKYTNWYFKLPPGPHGLARPPHI